MRVASINGDTKLQFWRLCAFIMVFPFREKFETIAKIIIPLIFQVLAAGSYPESSKDYILRIFVRLARIVLGLGNDVRRTVGGYWHTRHRDCA